MNNWRVGFAILYFPVFFGGVASADVNAHQLYLEVSEDLRSIQDQMERLRLLRDLIAEVHQAPDISPESESALIRSKLQELGDATASLYGRLERIARAQEITLPSRAELNDGVISTFSLEKADRYLENLGFRDPVRRAEALDIVQELGRHWTWNEAVNNALSKFERANSAMEFRISFAKFLENHVATIGSLYLNAFEDLNDDVKRLRREKTTLLKVHMELLKLIDREGTDPNPRSVMDTLKNYLNETTIDDVLLRWNRERNTTPAITLEDTLLKLALESDARADAIQRAVAENVQPIAASMSALRHAAPEKGTPAIRERLLGRAAR